MKKITEICPVVSQEISLGIQYILMSSIRGELYVLSEEEIRYIKKFGRPEKWELYSCIMEEIDNTEASDDMLHFCDTPLKRSYELCRHDPMHSSVVIDWEG